MVRRKPLKCGFTFLSILSIPFIFLISEFFLISTIVSFLLRFKVPFLTSMCPRCRKNNELEPWVTDYSCAHCQATLKKEENWSRLT